MKAAWRRRAAVAVPVLIALILLPGLFWYYRHYRPRYTLFMAAQRGDGEVVRKCLAEGVPVDARVSRWERTALGQAAGSGHTEVVKLLLAAGADVNAGDVMGMTPLHHAVSEGCLEDVELLIGAGADVNARDRNGVTPLYCCGFIEGKGFHKGVLDALVKAGVDVQEVRFLLRRASLGFNRAFDPETGEFSDYGLTVAEPPTAGPDD